VGEAAGKKTDMNYYQRHIGDYSKDTGHLTLLEHGVYGTLLDWQYASENSLPQESDANYRICRAFSRTERAAVDRIRSEFFKDGWNKRAKQEIEFCHEVSQQKRFGILRRHHPELRGLSDEKLEEWCESNGHQHSNGSVKYHKSSTTRARSNSQQPTANSIEGGAAAHCQVGDDEIMAWAAGWPGEPNSGTPKMHPEWVKEALVKINGRNSWPANWQKWLISVWRVDHRTFSAGDGGLNLKKNGGPVSASVGEISRQKKTAALSEEEDALAYDVNSLRMSNIEVPVEKLKRLAEIRVELKALNGGSK
jgi:uncharacterized protein YdaU (DUF1376 family)